AAIAPDAVARSARRPTARAASRTIHDTVMLLHCTGGGVADRKRSRKDISMDMRNLQTPLVDIRGAGVRRANRWLVEGIDLTVRPGEIVTMIGPNGSGKSTTARLVTGVLKPDAGTVTRREGLRIGYVPQKLSIDWTMPLTVDR